MIEDHTRRIRHRDDHAHTRLTPAGGPGTPARADQTDRCAGTVTLTRIAADWVRIGCVGFGGPPAHIALFRELCVERRGWLTDEEFEDAIAATSLLPGPGSTQLAIFCAWRLRGVRGALIGGLGFIVPGLIAILCLSALFLGASPPAWVAGAGAGAGAAVAAIAVQAAIPLLGSGWARADHRGQRRWRWLIYVGVGLIAVPLAGPWLVLLLLACGGFELAWRAGEYRRSGRRAGVHAWPVLAAAVAAPASGLAALPWLAFKVGALSYGGGFVIVPLMRADAVSIHHWLTNEQFLSAVALGQVTPGPVVHTVAAVGYGASGLGGALLASVAAFAPSFLFILIGARRFDRLRADRRVRAFLDGAGPAAAGAIIGSAIPLAAALTNTWQALTLALAAVYLLLARGGVVATLLVAGTIGAAVALAGGPLT